MKKHKLALLVLSALAVSAVHANNPQRFQACVNVFNNTSPATFKAGFESTDKFDWGTYSNEVSNGSTCSKPHTYQHGPKNMRFTLETNLRHILIRPDESCSFMHGVDGKVMFSSQYRATGSEEVWTFNLYQAEPVNGYRYTFDLRCGIAAR